MKKQTIDIKSLIEQANAHRKTPLNQSKLACLTYSKYGFTDSYCMYRFSRVINGKIHMTLCDLFDLSEATGLAFLQIIPYITINNSINLNKQSKQNGINIQSRSTSVGKSGRNKQRPKAVNHKKN